MLRCYSAQLALGRKPGVPFDHTVLHLDGAAHGVDHAAKLNNGSIAGALDHPPIVDGDYRVDQIATKRSQPRQYAILVGSGSIHRRKKLARLVEACA